MADVPKPNPSLFKNKRSTAVPKNRGGRRASVQPHGFSDTIATSGDFSLTGYVDTTVLFALGSCSDHAARLAFLSRYNGRAVTGQVVVAEVDLWASKNVLIVNVADRLVVGAAKTAKAALLKNNKIAVFSNVDSTILNAIMEQLEDYGNGGNWHLHRETVGVGPVQHSGFARNAGEAVLIAHAMSTADGLLLTNDAGASAVAKDRGILAWHFGHILRELLANDLEGLTIADAAEMFTTAMTVAEIRSDIVPSDLQGWLACRHAAEEPCPTCQAA